LGNFQPLARFFKQEKVGNSTGLVARGDQGRVASYWVVWSFKFGMICLRRCGSNMGELPPRVDTQLQGGGPKSGS